MEAVTLQQQLQHAIDFKTKPPGSLGQLEEIALQAGLIQNTLSPKIANPHIIIFAGDHGIAATGLVNPFPQAVTAQMVQNFLQGGAAINVFCRQNQLQLKVIDCGVNYDFDTTALTPNFINAKINYGTKNYLQGMAMTIAEANAAIEKGQQIVQAIYAEGCNTVGFGEMGIGNTSSAALIMGSIMQLPVEDCTGRGAGANDVQLATKIRTLKKVFQLHQLNNLAAKPVGLLAAIGGYEIAMMVGAFGAAAKLNMVIVVDGFITTAALLVAQAIDNSIIVNCIFAHNSGEQGHEKMLGYLNVKPLLQLNMRLGEGSGAALAIPLIISAVNFLNEMASFKTAGVSNKQS